ncbi:multispanning 7TM plasma membrane rhodopsin family protein, implicated in signalling [Schizosaccharomyces pombe]|uniref:Meiotically up-regulated gene 73 protein n=1 Tax=Schizosaccharomyces pombe (strain 972 / ATCC 24843) TaxID=284812 RepID=MUG73_SCHPO|nr:putative transporter mug73 [Schizosaccharomyces pombe]O74870.1 RecName: Full=Meiotically up-regulated gene 73 protein [Schizosaccharomyces pombe 972h-]CAA21219.1 membrane transporter (predicted) [Schizosaccharomyces pombe]|eukprot:NP_587895.1 putative transporter mug73 [Schizosaccharomyces pombe]
MNAKLSSSGMVLKELPEVALQKISSNYYWAVFAVFLLCAIVFPLVSIFSLPQKQTYHRFFSILSLVSCLAYFTMACNYGLKNVFSSASFFREVSVRMVYYVRYIQWLINFPLIIVMLHWTVGVSILEIAYVVCYVLFAIVCLLAAALTSSPYKWAYYGFSFVGYFIALAHSVVLHKKYASRLETSARLGFLWSIVYLHVIWFLYYACWILSEGLNVISPIGEAIFYSILDLFEFGFFGAAFSWMLDLVGIENFKSPQSIPLGACSPADDKFSMCPDMEAQNQADDLAVETRIQISNLPSSPTKNNC